MSQNNPILQVRRWIFRDGAPISRGLMVLLGVSLVLYFLLSGSEARRVFSELAWESDSGLRKPWTLVTYALTWVGGPGALWTALWAGFSLFYFGASLERGMGWRRFGVFLGVVTVSAPLALLLAASLARGSPIFLASFGLPATCLLVGWAARAPEATILFWGILPIKAKWLSLASFVFVLVSFGFGAPLRGVLALVPLAIAHFWLRGGVSLPRFGSKGTKEGTSAWERRREEELERLRLKELFERSYRENDEDGDKDS